MKISDKIIYIGEDMKFIQASREYSLKKYEEFIIKNIVKGKPLSLINNVKGKQLSVKPETNRSFIIQSKSGEIYPMWIGDSYFISICELRKQKLDNINKKCGL